MVLNAGTTKTITTNNVKVSNPRSLMTSTAVATSSEAYICDLAKRGDFWLEA